MRTEQEIKDRLIYIEDCIIQCAIENHGWVEPEMSLERACIQWILGADNLIEKDTDDSPSNPLNQKGNN